MLAFRKRISTVSVGCAPFRSQSMALSRLSVTVAGLVRGLYVPTWSIKRPSRGERESATTIL
jgi:hypothetical protein